MGVLNFVVGVIRHGSYDPAASTSVSRVFVDGTIAFDVAYPDGLSPSEKQAAEHIAKIVGVTAGTGQPVSELFTNVENHWSLRAIANASGVTQARITELVQSMRVVNTAITGEVRGLRDVPGFGDAAPEDPR